jgi:hypothetical protein
VGNSRASIDRSINACTCEESQAIDRSIDPANQQINQLLFRAGKASNATTRRHLDACIARSPRLLAMIRYRPQ